MGNNYRTYNPKQSFLLPPSPLEWLPEGHLAYFLLEVLETLDLSDIEDVFAKKDARGERPYAPRMLLALLVYGYCVGVFSSRKMAKATYEDVAFRVLAGGEHPHFTRIGDFRLQHRQALAGLFVQVLKLCARAGLVKLGHVALDGTKILANASKHKAMSYERMQKEEARLRAEVDALLAQGDATDQAEDERHGVGQNVEDLPEELRRRQSRLERIAAAKQELEREAAEVRAEQLRQRAQAQEEKAQDPSVGAVEQRRAQTRAKKSRDQADKLDGGDDDDEPKSGSGSGNLPEHHVQVVANGKPAPKAQRNFTDPDSKIMVKGGEFLQGYNAQAVVDSHAQIVIAPAVTNQAADAQHLQAMMALIAANLERLPERMSADCGYFSEDNAKACEKLGVDAYIAVSRTKHGAKKTEQQEAKSSTAKEKEKMKVKLETEEGSAIYARRKVIVEPVFGQIKAAQGFRRFSLRGLSKVRDEWSFVCMTHNLLKLFRNGGLRAAVA